MKKCPFCAEDIQDAAVVCKHCKRELARAPAQEAATASDKPALQRPVGRRGGLALLAVAVGFVLTLSTTTVGVGVFVLWFGLAFAMTGSSLVRWFGGMVLAIFLAAIGTAMSRGPSSSPQITTPAATSSSSSAPAAASAPTPPPEATYQLTLVSSRGYESDGGGYHIVEGQVKNTSNQSLKNVTAVATWFDKDGGFIKSDDAIVDYNPILPGQTSPFKTMSSTNPAMSKYTVEFKTLFGGTLSVDDQRKK